MTDWAVTLYHDEPDEAATDQTGYWLRGVDSADVPGRVRERLDEYWTTATADAGRVVRDEVEPGVSVEVFDDAEPMCRWYVGPDWADGPSSVI